MKRKASHSAPDSHASTPGSTATGDLAQPAKKKRGRPPKKSLLSSSTSGSGTSTPALVDGARRLSSSSHDSGTGFTPSLTNGSLDPSPTTDHLSLCTPPTSTLNKSISLPPAGPTSSSNTSTNTKAIGSGGGGNARASASTARPKSVVPERYFKDQSAYLATGLTQSQILTFPTYDELLRHVQPAYLESAREFGKKLEDVRDKAAEAAKRSREEKGTRLREMERERDEARGMLRRLIEGGWVPQDMKEEVRGVMGL